MVTDLFLLNDAVALWQMQEKLYALWQQHCWFESAHDRQHPWGWITQCMMRTGKKRQSPLAELQRTQRRPSWPAVAECARIRCPHPAGSAWKLGSGSDRTERGTDLKWEVIFESRKICWGMQFKQWIQTKNTFKNEDTYVHGWLCWCLHENFWTEERREDVCSENPVRSPEEGGDLFLTNLCDMLLITTEKILKKLVKSNQKNGKKRWTFKEECSC